MKKIKKFKFFLSESNVYDLMDNNAYIKTEKMTNNDYFNQNFNFEPLSKEETEYYLPLILEFVDKRRIEAGIKGDRYYYGGSEITFLKVDQNKKIERCIYTFRWSNKSKIPAFGYCFLYKLKDDFIMINFFLFSIGISENYIIDTYGGIEQFRKEQIKKKRTLNLNESVSGLMNDKPFKELEYEPELEETYNLKKEEFQKIEKDKIEGLIINYLEKFSTNLININKPSDNKSICFELENGNITIEKYEDEYFHLYIEMPLILVGYERYCDTRSQWREFLCDSIYGLEKLTTEDPFKTFYKSQYHMLNSRS